MYDVTNGCRHHSFDVGDWLIFFRGKYIGQRLGFVLNDFFDRFLADTQIPHTMQGKPTDLLPMLSICPNKTCWHIKTTEIWKRYRQKLKRYTKLIDIQWLWTFFVRWMDVNVLRKRWGGCQKIDQTWYLKKKRSTCNIENLDAKNINLDIRFKK